MKGLIPEESSQLQGDKIQSPDPKRKSQLGQFFTPVRIARFMAELFPQASIDTCHLLDAGAGVGSLSDAFLHKWFGGGFDFRSIELDAFEIDHYLHQELKQTLEKYSRKPHVKINIRGTDFIHAASNWVSGNLFAEALPQYTHAILNPPYKKIRSDSAHRRALRDAGIETVNLYTAFVALSLALLADRGQLVAIIPRSFCNGPYYRPFRKYILQRSVIRHMHLFESRSKAFKDDDVLQENVIIRLEKAGKPGPVTITTSTDDIFNDLSSHEHPCDRIVFPDDPEQFIHIPTSPGMNTIERSPNIRSSLEDIGVNISTGPVIDFRVKEYLRNMPEPGTIPLLYPGHFQNSRTEWPREDIKKPNAIVRNTETEKWLYPNDFYCVVRRFSSKEEKHRVVANVIDPANFDNAPLLGFENHLNVFHCNKKGMSKEMAYGLATFLNTSAVDEYFRRFNGHTQVNATDLKRMKYPTREILLQIGEWAINNPNPSQKSINAILESLSL